MDGKEEEAAAQAFLIWLVGWLVGQSVGRSVGRLVGWLVGRSVDLQKILKNKKDEVSRVI